MNRIGTLVAAVVVVAWFAGSAQAEDAKVRNKVARAVPARCVVRRGRAAIMDISWFFGPAKLPQADDERKPSAGAAWHPAFI